MTAVGLRPAVVAPPCCWRRRRCCAWSRSPGRCWPTAAARPDPRRRQPGPRRRRAVGLRGPAAPAAGHRRWPSWPTGALDAKSVAVLGVLAACGCALRLPGGVAGLRARVLPADPGRAGAGPRLRLRARRAHPVRLRADHRRRRTVAAVPDVRRGVGRLLRRLPPAGRGPARAGAAGRLRLRGRPGLRPAARPVVLALPVGAAPGWRPSPVPRWARTCTGSWPSTWPRPWGGTSCGPLTNAVLVLVAGAPVLAALRRASRARRLRGPGRLRPPGPNAEPRQRWFTVAGPTAGRLSRPRRRRPRCRRPAMRDPGHHLIGGVGRHAPLVQRVSSRCSVKPASSGRRRCRARRGRRTGSCPSSAVGPPEGGAEELAAACAPGRLRVGRRRRTGSARGRPGRGRRS